MTGGWPRTARWTLESNLARWLKDQGVRKVYVGGLATDYCVRATVLDALRHGFARR